MLPKELLQSLENINGFNLQAFEEVHASGAQVTSVRFNPAKPVDPAVVFDDCYPVPWSSEGYYLPARPSFTLDPLLHGGAYYVQEASSMFLEQCIRQTIDLSMPVKVLDLCAAPGGKSTLIQSLISEDSLLLSNEVIKPRVTVLAENLTKWGGANSIITNNDPRDFKRLENYFDMMVVDAPCSGSGLFRRDVSAIDEWSPQAVQMCSQRQQRILSDAYGSLKDNGILIYSTCSYSAEEDEDIADWLLDSFGLVSLPLDVPAEWNITESRSRNHSAFGYRFFPDQVRGEGFYICCFKKQGNGDAYSVVHKKQKLVRVTAKEENILYPWLSKPGLLNFYYLDNEVFAFPKALEQDLISISATLYLRKAGVMIGKIVRDELIPAHELVLSGLLSEKIVVLELKKEDALQYLRKEEVTIETTHRGWAVVQYKGIRLGWVKVLPNRSNNYYPKEWRILKSGNN